MDANKLKVLQEIGYKITSHCGICESSDLSADGWGYCNVNTYQHLKHSEETSRLSIHRMGSCGRFKLNGLKLTVLGLGTFREFVDE